MLRHIGPQAAMPHLTHVTQRPRRVVFYNSSGSQGQGRPLIGLTWPNHGWTNHNVQKDTAALWLARPGHEAKQQGQPFLNNMKWERHSFPNRSSVWTMQPDYWRRLGTLTGFKGHVGRQGLIMGKPQQSWGQQPQRDTVVLPQLQRPGSGSLIST